MPDGQSEVKVKMTLFADLKVLFDDHPILKIIFTALTGAVVGVITAYTFIDSKVNTAAESRLKPYEQLFTGLGLNQGEDYSLAARELETLIASKEFGNLSISAKALAYDGLLLAVANSDDVTDFQGALKAVSSKINKTGVASAWRQNQFGWSLMRLGDLGKARDYFVKSERSFKMRKDFASSSDPVRGLLIVSLLENDLKSAVGFGQELRKLRPSVYKTNLDLVAEIQERQNTRFFDSFFALYGAPLHDTINQYIAQLIQDDKNERKLLADSDKDSRHF